MSEKLYDVIAVEISTAKVRLMAENKPKRDAEAIVKFAVTRRGVDAEVFKVVPHGQHKRGDIIL